MVKKIKKILFIILLVLFFSIICNSYDLKAKGLVSQGWYNNNELHFITLTAPHPNTLKIYGKLSGTSGGFTKETEKVDIGEGTSFLNSETGTSNESYWVMYNRNKNLLSGDPAEGQFATDKLLFHKLRLASYGDGGSCNENNPSCYRYAITSANYPIPTVTNITSLANAYQNIPDNNKTNKSVIGNNNNPIVSLTIANGADSLYRMTLANRGGNKPVYVSERRISSSYVSTLKSNKLITIEENSKEIKNAILVSSQLKVKIGGSFRYANNPKAFMELGGTWGKGTRGWSNDKGLGSVLNLYDNILQFPTEASRTIIVKHINIGENNTITLDNVSRGATVSESKNISATDTFTCTKKEEYGTYIGGFNVGISSTIDDAKNAVTDMVRNGYYTTGETYTVKPSSSTDKQYVYIEMYYNSEATQPPEEEIPEEETKVVVRHIVYSGLGELKSTTETTSTIAAGVTETYYRNSDLGTYLGYIRKDNDTTIPTKDNITGSGTTSVNLVEVTAGQEGGTIFINFGYQSSDTVKVVVRDIYYSSNSVFLSSSMRGIATVTIGSTEEVKYSRLEEKDIKDGYQYVGYLIAYDMEIPFCDAYVKSDDCKIKGIDIRTKIYINFMYKEKEKKDPIPHQAPDPIIGGRLGIRSTKTLLTAICINTTATFPKYTGQGILSVPTEETIDIGMQDLNKYYIGGIKVAKEEKENKITKTIVFLKLVLVHDVNENKTKGVGIGFDILNFIIPYKYIEYNIKDFSIYKLELSDIYVPGQNALAKGPEIISKIEREITYNMIKASGVGLESKAGLVGEPIVLKGITVQPTLLGGASGILENDTIIDNDGNSVGNIKESTITDLSLDSGNIMNSISGSLNSLIGTYSGSSNLRDDILNPALSLISSASIDGYIIDTVHTYTRDSDDMTIREVSQRWLICVFQQLKGETPSSDCPDFSDVWDAIWGFIESKNKDGKFVYTGYDSNEVKKTVYKEVHSLLGFEGLAYATLTSLDDVRQINTKVELKTNESVSFLNLTYPGNSTGDTIGQSVTGASIVDRIVRGIFTKDISIWDINFKETGTLLGIKGIAESTKYTFEGYVNIFTSASGMRINSLGKEYYTKGFGGNIGDLDNSASIAHNITYNTYQTILKEQLISEKRVNGIRSLAEETTYNVYNLKGDTTFDDNLYYSNLNLLGIKNVFPFTGTNKTKEHNSDEGTSDLINVYTPIEIDDEININSDDKLISQLTDKSAVPAAFFNSKFSFDIGVGEYKNGKYSALDGQKLDKYCDGFYVKFSFVPEYIEIEEIAGTIDRRENLSKDKYYYFELSRYKLTTPDNKLTITVKALNEISGSVFITVRAAAKNLKTDADIKTKSLSLDYISFFTSYSNICNDTSYDISKVDAPVYYDEKEFEITSNNISRLYDFRITDVKDVNWKNIFRNSTSSTSHNGTAYYVGLKKWDIIKGMVTRTESEVGKYLNRTLPIGPYKSTDGSYIAAPKIGYRIAFDVKKSYPDNENSKRHVKIDTEFFYLKKDGTVLNNAIDLYYKNSSGNYVKVGSTDDKYKITFTPNEETRLLDIGDNSLSSKTIELGSLTGLTLEYNTMSTKSSDHQTFYGEYKLPNSTIVVESGKSPKDKNNILSNGYLGVMFKISSTFRFASESEDRIISYQVNMNDEEEGTNEWKYEGYMGQKYGLGTITKQLQLEKGRLKINNDVVYGKFEGTVVLFDLDNRAANDYD